MSIPSLRSRGRIIVGVAATFGLTFAMFKLANGEIFSSVLVLSAVVGVLLLLGEAEPRSSRTVLGAGLLTFAAVASWWPLVERFVLR